ncbi:Intradiol ring-cleavage dioxygenase [Xylariomycetidae sp. FL2044]|nr:Intradiol ring-cleavage dioxygenase [Xylariomycetidae sp. FL2044]
MIIFKAFHNASPVDSGFGPPGSLFLDSHTNALEHCISQHHDEGLLERVVARRSLNHKSDEAYDPSTGPSVVFPGNNSCGVPLHLDIQMIDVSTCEPVSDVFLEIWSANSTGVYSGALAIPNGSGIVDQANLDKAFLRGVQKTDEDGVVQFETIFPGHYSGRATHIHLTTHPDTKAEANNTLWSTRVTHAGQAQLLITGPLVTEVEKRAPYNTNPQPMTANARDSILLQEAAMADPFFEYGMPNGVFAWFSSGVDATFSRDIMPVAMKSRALSGIFPGGFPTAYQPGYGPPSPTPAPDVSSRK